MARSSDLTQYASQVIEHSDTDALNLSDIETGYNRPKAVVFSLAVCCRFVKLAYQQT